MHNAAWVGLVVFVATTLGCGGGSAESTTEETTVARVDGPSGPAHGHGDHEVTTSVGPDGGYLQLGNGARIDIPQGALTAPVEITFRRGESTNAFAREEAQAIGPTLNVSPEVTPAQGQIRVSIPMGVLPAGFAAEDLALAVEGPDPQQRALEMGNLQTRWTNFAARVEGNRVVADLDMLPGYRVQFIATRVAAGLLR